MEKQQQGFFSDKIGSILTDKEIAAQVANSLLIAKENFSQESLQPASYDFRVGERAVIGGEGVEIDLKEKNLQLPPGSYAGIISLEKMRLPNTIGARISSKRALSYDGIILLTGGTVDPGYEGYLLFGLYNASSKKVVIPFQKKICNVVFERLADKPERHASSDPHLRRGAFPESFIDKMANMDVLPWMQMSERVKQIETITKDILELKNQYNDVLKPIRELTADVSKVSQAVLANNTQISDLTAGLKESRDQISQLSKGLAEISSQTRSVQNKADEINTNVDRQMLDIQKLKIWQTALIIIGTLVFGVVTAMLGAHFSK